MNKQKEIIIGQGEVTWQKGISLSPYLGFGDMRNVETSLWPGVAKIVLAASKKSGTTITGTPLWAVQDIDTAATIYVLDNANKVYKSTNASQYGTWSLVTHASPSTGHGNGMAIWHNYLFIAGDAAIDVMKISNGAWTDAWKTLLSDTLTHPFLASTNDVLYVGQGPDSTNILGPTLASVQQVTSKVFDPTDATTFTWTANAVGANMLYGYRIRCLAQMGSNVYIGTFFGSAIGDQKIADIFPWDRSSASFGVPIRLKEYGINQMLTINNVIYFQAGSLGNFYVTNGSLTQPLFSFPRGTNTAVSIYGTASCNPGAIIFNKGRIFFGITLGATNNGASGVYSVNTDGTGLVLENTISTGSSDSRVTIGCLHPTLNSNMEYMIGWADSGASAQGVDTIGEDGFVSGYAATIDTQVFAMGTVLSPSGLTQIEIYLDRPLAPGEGVKVLQRSSLATPWSSATTILTYDYATFGTSVENQRINRDIGPNSSGEMLQFQIQLTCTSGSNGTTPTLRYIRII